MLVHEDFNTINRANKDTFFVYSDPNEYYDNNETFVNTQWDVFDVHIQLYTDNYSTFAQYTQTHGCKRCCCFFYFACAVCSCSRSYAITNTHTHAHTETLTQTLAADSIYATKWKQTSNAHSDIQLDSDWTDWLTCLCVSKTYALVGIVFISILFSSVCVCCRCLWMRAYVWMKWRRRGVACMHKEHNAVCLFCGHFIIEHFAYSHLLLKSRSELLFCFFHSLFIVVVVVVIVVAVTFTITTALLQLSLLLLLPACLLSHFFFVDLPSYVRFKEKFLLNVAWLIT